MKRILQVVSCLELGGTEAFIINNYRNIDRTQIQFDFLVFIENDYPYIDEIKKLGGRIFFGGSPNFKNINKFIQSTINIIKKNGPYDAVHSHVNIDNTWVMYAAKKAGVPIRISHSHAAYGMGGNFLKLFYRKTQLKILKKSSTHFLSCSQNAGEYLYGRKFFEENGRVINNGINIDLYLDFDDVAVSNLRKEFNLPNDCFTLGNITRFDKNKNIIFILEVFEEILKINVNSILILGGVDGGELNKVIEKSKHMGIYQKIRFIGKRNDVPSCLKLIDAYLFPSLHEGLGIALLEAQASGCACFASTGVSKEVDMGINRVTFIDLKENAQKWARVILEKYDQRDFNSNEKIRNSFFEKDYLIENTVKNLVSIYEGK